MPVALAAPETEVAVEPMTSVAEPITPPVEFPPTVTVVTAKPWVVVLLALLVALPLVLVAPAVVVWLAKPLMVPSSPTVRMAFEMPAVRFVPAVALLVPLVVKAVAASVA